ncbi:MAG: o-succinylbenzoate synthase [Acidobacteria bacterium]|nr:o-succinylbenzoate synthase [Acidobacteriota bacterium]MBI1984452.1 o-succinylbenzoate synthase [Acidobacteriota bacterium]
MKISRVEIREIRMPLAQFFETSFARTTTRRIVLVRVEADGLTGWGEVTCGEAPFYSHETPETAWHILRDFLVPWSLEGEWKSAGDLAPRFRPIRGHNMAKAALENALWDIEAQQKGVSLAKLIGATLEEIPCGVSVGIQNSVEELLEKIRSEIAAGYQRIKIKIKPGWDIEILDRVRQEFPRVPLMADANSAYTLADLPRLKLLDRFYLMMVEQPLGWEDIYDHAKLQRELATPLCLDESIHGAEDARKAIEAGACKIINVKLGRVGGFSAARQVHDVCRAKNVPVWCGGMLESGVGRAHNIALSALPGFTLPGDVSASRRYWTEDIIDPEVTVTKQGTIRVPQIPGLGFAPNMERIEEATVRNESFG